MKRLCSALLACLLILSAAACGQKAVATYQEQYDLGVKYLDDGNYQEAVVAFTAAIDIEAKHPEAYIGLADAYVGLGDTESAKKALEDGLAACGENAELQGKLDELTPAEETEPAKAGYSANVTAEAVILDNSDTYEDQWAAYLAQYQTEEYPCVMDSYGIRFSQPVTVEIDGQSVTVSEARFSCQEDVLPHSQLSVQSGDGGESAGPLIGVTLRVTGQFSYNEQTEELAGPLSFEEGGEVVYNYRPNGPIDFTLTSYETVS